MSSLDLMHKPNKHCPPGFLNSDLYERVTLVQRFALHLFMSVALGLLSYLAFRTKLPSTEMLRELFSSSVLCVSVCVSIMVAGIGSSRRLRGKKDVIVAAVFVVLDSCLHLY